MVCVFGLACCYSGASDRAPAPTRDQDLVGARGVPPDREQDPVESPAGMCHLWHVDQDEAENVDTLGSMSSINRASPRHAVSKWVTSGLEAEGTMVDNSNFSDAGSY